MITFLSTHSVEIIAIPFTLILNAILVACEFSLTKIRFSHFDTELRQRVEAHKRISPLIRTGDRTIRVIRMGLTACLFLYILFVFPLINNLCGLFGIEILNSQAPLALILAFLFSLVLHQLVGEYIPRGLGLAYPMESLRIGAPVIIVLARLMRPVRWFVRGLVRLFWRLAGHDKVPDLDSLELETQVQLLGKESPEMSTVAQLILKNTLILRELVVADVLLPRNQVKYFDLNLPLKENLAMARESGHTRFPLCYGDLDHCLGLIHIKDLFRSPGNIYSLDLRRIKRNMIRIDSEVPLETALTKLLSHRMHMALVLDEFRGTEGVLTLERILEQLVGEIRDEFDADEEVLIREDVNTDDAVVSGLTPLHEVEAKYGLEFEEEDVSTIGGLITSELGRIPVLEERLFMQGLEIEITGVDETRVIEVRIRPADNEDTETVSEPGK